jgi:hypothetical protein
MFRNLLIAAALCVMTVSSSAADGAKEGERCGTILIFHAECDAGLWCQMPPGQCAERAGTCAKAPEICSQIFRPVCGCNGQTFSNDCERQVAKVSKAHDGSCS